jgi:hypothetical protein
MQAQRGRVVDDDAEDEHEIENANVNQVQAVSFKKVEELENFGINKTDIKKLKEGGYNTVQSVRSHRIDYNFPINLIIFILIWHI